MNETSNEMNRYMTDDEVLDLINTKPYDDWTDDEKLRATRSLKTNEALHRRLTIIRMWTLIFSKYVDEWTQEEWNLYARLSNSIPD